MSVNLRFTNADSFIRAINTTGPTMRDRARVFFTRARAEYDRILLRSPWRIGGSPGGVPTDTKSLRDTLQREVTSEYLRITPTQAYAGWVHDGTSKMEARPFFDHAKQAADARIRHHEDQLLAALQSHLAG